MQLLLSFLFVAVLTIYLITFPSISNVAATKMTQRNPQDWFHDLRLQRQFLAKIVVKSGQFAMF